MPIDEADTWAAVTWDGARRAQLRAWRRLPLPEKLAAVEAMCDLARWFHERRAKRGLPTIPLSTDDPATVRSRVTRGVGPASSDRPRAC